MFAARFAIAVFALGGVALAATTGPSDRPAKQTAEDLYTMAAVSVGAGKFEDAEKLARRGIKEFPAAQGFHLMLGESFFYRKKYADAFYEYQWEMLRSGPQSPTGSKAAKRTAQIYKEGRGTEADEARNVIKAVALAEKGDTIPANKLLLRMKRERGDRFALNLFIAENYTRIGKFKDAEAIYRSLLKQDPYFVPAYLQLAGVMKKTGKEKEASQLFAKAEQVDPNHWQLQIAGTRKNTPKDE